MSIQTKAKKLAILFGHPEILLSKKKYLFVVSHMRSRSTVLSHIIGNNAEVCGYKELHRSYKGRLSLINMQIELVNDLQCDVRNTYLFDKILNNFTISDEILHKAQPKILFLLREPESTIKSIMNMGFKTGVDWYKDPVKVTHYYRKRLRNMEKLAVRAGEGNLYIDSNDLVGNSEVTLNKITGWLHLKEPLKTTYATFRDTGVPGYGDPLENIKSGTLKATEGYPEIVIPDELLKEAEAAYENCRTLLLKMMN